MFKRSVLCLVALATGMIACSSSSSSGPSGNLVASSGELSPVCELLTTKCKRYASTSECRSRLNSVARCFTTSIKPCLERAAACDDSDNTAREGYQHCRSQAALACEPDPSPVDVEECVRKNDQCRSRYPSSGYETLAESQQRQFDRVARVCELLPVLATTARQDVMKCIDLECGSMTYCLDRIAP